MTFFWGLQDSAMSIHLDSILGFEFTSNKEPFSIDVLLESITAFTFEVIQSYINNRLRRMIYILSIGILGILMAFCTYFFEFRSLNNTSKFNTTFDRKTADNTSFFKGYSVYYKEDDNGTSYK